MNTGITRHCTNQYKSCGEQCRGVNQLVRSGLAHNTPSKPPPVNSDVESVTGPTGRQSMWQVFPLISGLVGAVSVATCHVGNRGPDPEVSALGGFHTWTTRAVPVPLPSSVTPNRSPDRPGPLAPLPWHCPALRQRPGVVFLSWGCRPRLCSPLPWPPLPAGCRHRIARCGRELRLPDHRCWPGPDGELCRGALFLMVDIDDTAGVDGKIRAVNDAPP